ncbi:restriction endonuclease subunit S [Clavibacter michiganensis]|uniref:restriction endonuclease subunit S n=1 Tax=Clavibacter michiganensis TaxID=28447 RepID=UPI0011773DEE|nr:restriction endonuclease subunit S [Clavibacter michiganensis]
MDKHAVSGETEVRLCNYTDVYYRDAIEERDDYMVATATPGQVSAYSVKEGDVVFTKDSESADDIGVSAYVPKTIPGLVYGYHLSTYRPKDKRYGRFLKWVLDSAYAKAIFQSRTLGVTRVGLSQATIRYLRVPTPPAQVAEEIADYLDSETSKIDAFIADQEELVKLLLERRSAIVSHSTSSTTGTPRVPVRRLIVSLSQGWSPNCENYAAAAGEWGVLKVNCVNGGRFDADKNKALPAEIQPQRELAVKSGDVLMSRGNTRDLVGSAALVGADHPNLLISDLLYRLKPNNAMVTGRYLVAALSGREARGQLESSAKGTSASMQKLSQGDILNVRIAVPSLGEQLVIADRLDRETAELDAALADARGSISLSRELRATLISAAVTGRIDLRRWRDRA